MRFLTTLFVSGLVLVVGLFTWEALGVRRLAIKTGKKLGTRNAAEPEA